MKECKVEGQWYPLILRNINVPHTMYVSIICSLQAKLHDRLQVVLYSSKCHREKNVACLHVLPHSDNKQLFKWMLMGSVG